MIGHCMGRGARRVLPALGIVVLMHIVSPQLCHAGETGLIRFEIADQFDRDHTDTELRGGYVLVVGADRKGSRYQGRWTDALKSLAGSRLASADIRIVEVADLRGVPFFVKGSVKKKFPSDKRLWVLMDWKGVFARAYAFEEDRCNLLLFDPAGELLYRAAVEDVDEAVLDEVVRRVNASGTGRSGRARRAAPPSGRPAAA